MDDQFIKATLLNVAVNFQMLSETSVNDLRQIGPTLGMSERLDNHRSNLYYDSGAAASRLGVGLTNYRPCMLQLLKVLVVSNSIFYKTKQHCIARKNIDV
jgi:hypothetical protein